MVSYIPQIYPDPYVMTSAMNGSTAQMAFENGIQTLIFTLVIKSEETIELNLTIVYLK
jgi:hypothetical protein